MLAALTGLLQRMATAAVASAQDAAGTAAGLEVVEAAMRCGAQCVAACQVLLHEADVLPALFAVAADGCGRAEAAVVSASIQFVGAFEVSEALSFGCASTVFLSKTVPFRAICL
eukprot:SAG22_NODE_106_length_19904_cov_14.387175_10_plen_114_part_00